MDPTQVFPIKGFNMESLSSNLGASFSGATPDCDRTLAAASNRNIYANACLFMTISLYR